MDWKSWYKKNRHGLIIGNSNAIHALRPVHDSINERAKLVSRIAGKITDGQVGIIWSGMDCDCVQFSFGAATSAKISNLMSYLHSSHEDAEGPLSFQFVTVKEANEYCSTSRDLALEAFENGHSQVVYY